MKNSGVDAGAQRLLYSPAWTGDATALSFYRSLPVIDHHHVRWLVSAGVPPLAIGSGSNAPLKFCFGTISDGSFLPVAGGQKVIGIAIEEGLDVIDVVAWDPRTDALGTLTGAAFALGEHHIDNPAICAMGGWLSVWQSPLDWLRAGREGIVILDDTCASSRLRFVSVLEARTDEHAIALRNLVRPPPGPLVFIAGYGGFA